jgi:uncharacterized protein (UPF0548 family)
MPIRLRRPSDRARQQTLFEVSGQPLTYPEVGATDRPELPGDGYHNGRHAVALGQGVRVFEAGVDALRTWQPHHFAGASLVPEVPAIEVGSELVSVLRAGPLHLVVPCRIVYVTDEPRRFGYAYGTLPGHPESGEESFHIEMDGRDQVTCCVAFFSRLVDPLARLGSPIAWRLQRRVTARYLEGVRRFVVSTTQNEPPASRLA